MNVERLEKLAGFLDNLPVEKFNFSIIARQQGKPMLEALAAGAYRCGTVACAMGWTPAVFPEELGWVKSGNSNDLSIGFKDSFNYTDTWTVISKFFGLRGRELDFLFCPGLSGLDETAQPYEVAQHIRRFIAEGVLYALPRERKER